MENTLEQLIDKIIDKIEEIYAVGQIPYSGYKDLIGLARISQIQK